MINHDFLFKELLTNFFAEFVDLFSPDLARKLDSSSILSLDKEVFARGKKNILDLVVRTRCTQSDSFFLIHIEVQSHHRAGFDKRLFHCYSQLHKTYDLPVYPIALLSFDRPRTLQPSEFVIKFDHLETEVLRFHYKTIQLNNLHWQHFLNRPNPVAAALMVIMSVARHDRPHVQLECLRLLSSLNLAWSKECIVSSFINTYLNLDAEEMKQYMKERSQLPQAQQKKIERLETSWFRDGLKEGHQGGLQEGLQKGLQQGLEEGLQKGETLGMIKLARNQLIDRLGALDSVTDKRLQKLSPEQLFALVRALSNFESAADLNQWLDSQLAITT